MLTVKDLTFKLASQAAVAFDVAISRSSHLSMPSRIMRCTADVGRLMTMYSACCRFDAGLSEQKDLVRWMDTLLRRMSDLRNHTAIVSAVSMTAIEPQDWWKCCLVDPDEEERVDLISAADDLMLMIATGNEFFPDAGFIKLRGVYETYKDHIMCCWPEMPSARIICRNLMDKFRLYGAVQEENRSLAFSYELLDYLADDPSDYEKDDARTGPDTEFMGT